MNKIKGQQEQECLDKIKDCFRKSNYSKDDAEALFYGKALTYGFQYNAGQKPKLKDEFSDYGAESKFLMMKLLFVIK